MKISIKQFGIVFFGVLSLQCFALDTAVKLNYRKESGVIIPGEIDIEGRQTIDAPVGDSIESPILKVKINNQGPFYFAFTTSNYESLISERLAKALQLPIVKGRAINLNHSEGVLKDTYFISNLEVGGVTVKNYGVMASSKFGNDINQISSVRIDGYLSASAFYSLLLTLDLKNEKIHLEKGKLSSDEDDVMPYSMISPVPIVKAQIKFSKLNVSESQHFLLSTGNYMYIFINVCNLPEMLKFKEQKGRKSIDIFGKEKADYFTELDGEVILSKSIVIKSPYVYFGKSACNASEPLGLLGVAFFEKYQVTIDQTNKLVRITQY